MGFFPPKHWLILRRTARGQYYTWKRAEALSRTSDDESQASLLATGPKTLLSSAHVPVLNHTMGLWRAWSRFIHSHTSDKVLIFKQRNIRDRTGDRPKRLKSQLHLRLLEKKMISHNSAISDINISQIVFPLSKEIIICKHLQNALC